MQKLIITMFLGILSISDLLAWEAGTHQALTKLALEGDSRSENMKNNFINEFDLSKITYEKYGDVSQNVWVTKTKTYSSRRKHYIDVATDLASQAKLPISPLITTYEGLFEAGAILEDTAMSTKGLDVNNGRFNNHFYDPGLSPPCHSLHGSNSSACAKDWAKNIENNFKFNNDFSWESAYDYYYKALRETDEEKRKALQADLFVSLGHISHLVEDMTQAAHVRDDSHPFTNVFETWANDHFNAINMHGDEQESLFANELTYNPENFDAIFDDTAKFTHDNFYSDGTIDGDWADGSHPFPKNGVTAIQDDTKIVGNEYFYYIRSNKFTSHNKLAIFEKGIIDDYSLIETINKKMDYSVLTDNATHLFPKAIAAIEGMINYFFRGKISAIIHPDYDNKIVVTNRIGNSEIDAVVSTSIKSGSTIEVIHKKEGLVVKKTLDNDLEDTEDIEIEIPGKDSINASDYIIVLKGTDGDYSPLVAGTNIDDKCKVFFTGAVVADHQSDTGISEVYVLDSWSEYVGAGEYPDNEKAFPNAVASTFDGIAIDKGTKITIYSGKDFTGEVLYEKVGPAILNNMLWKDDSRYGPKVDTTWKEPLETEYPRSVRSWSNTNMHNWSYGSTKIECGY